VTTDDGRAGIRLVLVLAGASLAALTGPAPVRQLEVRDARDRAVLAIPVHDGERVDVAFTHSSEKCRWTQHYEVRGFHFDQVGSTFPCFGPGMPTASWDGGPLGWGQSGFTAFGGGRLDSIPMLYSRAADIRLVVRGTSTRVGDRLADFEAFHVRVR
jgi:hypothetical protein